MCSYRGTKRGLRGQIKGGSGAQSHCVAGLASHLPMFGFLEPQSIAMRPELSGILQSAGQFVPLRYEAAFTCLWDQESINR